MKQVKYQTITPKNYVIMTEQVNQVILIDVRTPEEYSLGKIKNAKLLPVLSMPYVLLEMYPDKEAPYVLYCRSGVRSKDAAIYMIQKGYQQVYDLGGIIDWPYEIV